MADDLLHKALVDARGDVQAAFQLIQAGPKMAQKDSSEPKLGVSPGSGVGKGKKPEYPPGYEYIPDLIRYLRTPIPYLTNRRIFKAYLGTEFLGYYIAQTSGFNGRKYMHRIYAKYTFKDGTYICAPSFKGELITGIGSAFELDPDALMASNAEAPGELFLLKQQDVPKLFAHLAIFGVNDKRLVNGATVRLERWGGGVDRPFPGGVPLWLMSASSGKGKEPFIA